MSELVPQVYDPTRDLRPYQWGLNAVQAEDAWSYATGKEIIVAVVDTGVDGLHPDLQGRVEYQWYDAWNLTWVYGYDSSWGPTYSPRFQRWYEGSHGTHVAGIIAAKRDGVGITGLAPDARILSIRIFSPDPVVLSEYGHYYVGDYGVAAGIVNALVYGARVFNNSWGGKGYSQTLKAAIDLALDVGAVFIASMGNSYLDEVLYPAGYPGVIGVGATTPQDKKADFSTMGGHISVGAPGTRVLSCVPRWMTQAGTGLPLLYDYWDGTSMAGPFVSALAAMILERHPAATPYQVRRVIEQAATDVELPGFDRRTGYGRIDAARAVQINALPTEGALAAVFVVTKSSNFPIPYVDITLRKNGVDRYFGQTDFEGFDIGIFPVPGGGFFLEVEPGTYDVLVGGEDTTFAWMRVANRVTAKKTVTLNPGINPPIVLEVNTTLKVTLTWSEAVDLDLAVLEYDPTTRTYVWCTPKTGAQWGHFSDDVQAGGTETYELKEIHWDYDIYYLAIMAYGISSTAKVTVVQNGVSESYGPYFVSGDPLNPSLYPSFNWPDWWENARHPYFGVKGPGGPVVY
ncbi:MAG: S8 family serine peptidase [Candidatus Bipolaricaulaceae bacterium]